MVGKGLWFRRYVQAVPEWEGSAVCFPDLGDPAEEGAGDGAGFFHGFAGYRAFEILVEGRHKEVQPAIEVRGIYREVDVFGKRLSGVTSLSEQRHVPEIVHSVEVGLPVLYAGVKNGAKEVVSADFIVESVDELFYVIEPCYI